MCLSNKHTSDFKPSDVPAWDCCTKSTGEPSCTHSPGRRGSLKLNICSGSGMHDFPAPSLCFCDVYINEASGGCWMGQVVLFLLRHTGGTPRATGYSLFSYCRFLGTVIHWGAAKPTDITDSSLLPLWASLSLVFLHFTHPQRGAGGLFLLVHRTWRHILRFYSQIRGGGCTHTRLRSHARRCICIWFLAFEDVHKLYMYHIHVRYIQ